MAGVFVVLTAFLLCLPDPSEGISIEQSPPVDFSAGIKIVQSPPSLCESPECSAELQCYHGDNSYNIMYWYQQTSKGALELIGYLNNKAIYPEEKFKERFNLTGHAKETGILTISRLRAEDSAVYFCAASINSAADHISPLQ
ncbi:UNVERIFIED_CONTAM: hypothetical protein FKN15_062057 [Acipenser sinensis]